MNCYKTSRISVFKVNYCKLENYLNFSVDVYHFDNITTTGTSVIATEKNICATNNDYHLIILPVVFCFLLVLFMLSVILFRKSFDRLLESFDTAFGELCTEILHVQKFEQSYVTGYYVTYCLRSPQLTRGTEQTAQPDPFSPRSNW